MSSVSKSPWIIHYDGSSCNGCDIEVLAALTPLYDVERFGIPVDVYAPGCAIRPEAIIDAVVEGIGILEEKSKKLKEEKKKGA